MWFKRSKATPTTVAPERAQAPEDLPALLARLDWRVLRRLDGLLQGDHRTLFKGAGLDLAELREYLPEGFKPRKGDRRNQEDDGRTADVICAFCELKSPPLEHAAKRWKPAFRMWHATTE